MITTGNEKIVDYFMAELQSLRSRTEAFAQDYPEVANELRIGSGRSDDPHVEMLLQSFAYMTGRLRYNLDSDLPEVSVNLLKYLYPHLEVPIPSMGVLQIEPLAETVDFAGGYHLEKGRMFKRKVHSRENREYDCWLRTSYKTKLWPLQAKSLKMLPTNRFEVIDQEYPEVRSVLHFSIQALNDITLEELEVDSLRVFINAGNPGCFHLYDHLQNNLVNVLVGVTSPDGEKQLKQASVKWLGYEPDDALLPYNRTSHPGYRLIQEYFTFPEKFLFFDLEGMEGCGEEDQLELYFLFNKDLSKENLIDEDSLLLNSVPVINLFNMITDPVRLDQKQFEYLLIPDTRQYRVCEIHSINKVIGTDIKGKSKEIAAFLPQHDIYTIENDTRYWSARRDFAERKHFPGTEMYLSFHDQSFNIAAPATESVYAEVQCTNRDLVEYIRVGTQLSLVGEGPIKHAVMIAKPTRYREPLIRGKQPWQLVSHLTLNFSTLGQSNVEGETRINQNRIKAEQKSDNVLTIQNLLRMYGDANNLNHQRLIDAIINVNAESSMVHIGKDAWRGFYEGTKVTITLDEARVDHTSMFLFGEIMRRFLSLYATVNSFVSLQLETKQRSEALKIWPPMNGEKALL